MTIMNETAAALIAELRALVRDRSSIPKVAETIGMNHYALRDNLNGKTEMKLSTFYNVLDAIGVSEAELKRRAGIEA